MTSKEEGSLKSVSDLLNQNQYQLPGKPPTEEDPTRGGIPPETFYYPVYPVLAERLGLSRVELNLLCAIWALQQNEGWCYTSQVSLAYWVRVSVQTLNTLLRQLESKGLLERGGTRSRLYTVRWRLGSEVEDLINYILQQIDKRREENKEKRKWSKERRSSY